MQSMTAEMIFMNSNSEMSKKIVADRFQIHWKLAHHWQNPRTEVMTTTMTQKKTSNILQAKKDTRTWLYPQLKMKSTKQEQKSWINPTIITILLLTIRPIHLLISASSQPFFPFTTVQCQLDLSPRNHPAHRRTESWLRCRTGVYIYY